MVVVVTDTSALVSLGTVAAHPSSPLDILIDSHDVVVPEQVVEELRETASYADPSAHAAGAVLDRRAGFDVRGTRLDETFPLDSVENAAVTLANDLGADQLVCDEFQRLARIHASLAETRLVTSPTLILALVRNGHLPVETGTALLETMGEARSWETNAYVARVQATLTRVDE